MVEYLSDKLLVFEGKFRLRVGAYFSCEFQPFVQFLLEHQVINSFNK